ncbi:transcriptional regulator, TetR family [Desulfotomaculum arcticum]|uniref:Transcriptional regulator, TetR family n=1 Tax=Desulfotruncus arcticus DSM 17038 TaxID=1121424 RepID=A0A1I2SRY0_9FIRM|nr:TetR/AcrR family transcriptional regulator [Desulfotruncus arcticus]SFG54579.1 transcriptional regulator, TetR family [Desulfotomaculum arcticum] [Desulfotruncus arcticus DSM 17038]
MVKTRLERKKEETKKKIISVAMNLFKSQGFDSTTVEQIAEEADIAKGTIYLHFPMKEAIISEYLRAAVRELGPDVIQALRKLPDMRSRLVAIFIKSQEWIEKEITRDLERKYVFYRIQTLEKSVRNVISAYLTEIIALGQKEGEIRDDVPADLLALQLEAVHFFTVITWLAEPEKFSLADRITLNVELFLNGSAAGAHTV